MTIAEVMFTIRPNRRSIIAGSTARMSMSAASMFASSAAVHASSVVSRNDEGVGPALLFTRMSGCGHAASSAARPSAVVMSPATAPIATAG